MIAIGKLTFDDLESAEEYFEQEFFEVKQQLQAKPLLRATAKQRIKSLQELQLFEEALELESSSVSISLPVYEGLNMQEAWLIFSNSYSSWKLKSFNASTPSELLELLEVGFNLQKDFYALIPAVQWEEEDPKVGATEQLMNLHSGFAECKSRRIRDFEQLTLVPFAEIKANETLYLFFLELKRLSLRFQYV